MQLGTSIFLLGTIPLTMPSLVREYYQIPNSFESFIQTHGTFSFKVNPLVVENPQSIVTHALHHASIEYNLVNRDIGCTIGFQLSTLHQTWILDS
jgi:hypothetical protein